MQADARKMRGREKIGSECNGANRASKRNSRHASPAFLIKKKRGFRQSRIRPSRTRATQDGARATFLSVREAGKTCQTLQEGRRLAASAAPLAA